MSKFDELAERKFGMVKNYQMQQRLNILDGSTCDCFPNSYAFTDMDKPIAVAGHKKPDFTPVWFAEEESSCCCRTCCSPSHSYSVKFYHADPVPTAGTNRGCACLDSYTGHQYQKDPSNPHPVFTIDRAGCCQSFPGKCVGGGGCPVFCAMCQDTMYVFNGNKVGVPGSLHLDGGIIAVSEQPICGGGCTPTLLLNKGDASLSTPFGAIEGPTCFGGLKDLLCATPFTISSTTGGSGDRGMITKNRPEDCLGMCCAVCTDIDGYTINLAQQNDAVETATTLGAAIQLDFMFFEKDNSFCEYDAQNEIIYITMCYWYMCGLLVPCKCCISTRQG